MIAADQNLIAGTLFLDGPVLRPDAVERRIETLVNTWLIHLADDPISGAWLRLYKAPSDGRLWELTYPQGEMQGGGPRRLRVITPAEAAQTFRWVNEV